MGSQRWTSWAGVAAILGGLTAIVLTPAFAAAYFLAYPGEDLVPFWFPAIESQLVSVLTFSSSTDVYNIYGRIFTPVYALFLPAAVGLHQLHRGSSSRREKRAFVVLVGGLTATFVGVAGDYWANGIGFPIEVLGLLTLAIGSTMYGIALLGSGALPGWCAWLFVASGPAAFGFLFLVGHIPSGATLPFAVSWVIVGFMLLFRRGIRPPPIMQREEQKRPRG